MAACVSGASAGLLSAYTVRCRNIGMVTAAERTVRPLFRKTRRVCIVLMLAPCQARALPGVRKFVRVAPANPRQSRGLTESTQLILRHGHDQVDEATRAAVAFGGDRVM